MTSYVNDCDKDFKGTPLYFNMIADRRTEMYVKFAKVMVILQGPVTENRRKVVSELENRFKHCCRVISDQTYKKETNRSFSPEQTKDFYKYLKTRVKKTCEEGYNLIIIDQSMSNTMQNRYYFFLAQTFQYVVLPVPPLASINSYERGESSRGPIKTQATSFLDRVDSCVQNLFRHIFCGWFLHDIDSAELREEASLYAADCFENIAEFNDLFSKVCKPHSFKTLYGMEDTRQSLAYCTVKIFKGDMDAKDYMSNEHFKQFYGKMSKLYIVGFIISPHMVAARVKLTHEQKPLWCMPDDLNEKFQPEVFPSELLKSTRVSMPKETVSLLSSKSNRTLISGNSNDEPTKVILHNARGRSCHFLLGKVNNAEPRNVDYDVPFAVYREKCVVPKYSDDVIPYDLDRCLVRRIGKYWFIYLKETLIVNGFFATCCTAESNVV